MVRSIVISWEVVDNVVADRMIDGSLNHMFSQHRKIRKKTQISNREFKQLSSVNSYKKYCKIKNTILNIVSDNDDTTEDCLSHDDINDAHQFIGSADDHHNSDDENQCNNHSNNNENDICNVENSNEISQPSNSEAEIKNGNQNSIEELFHHDKCFEHDDDYISGVRNNRNISLECSYKYIDDDSNITKEEIKSAQSPKYEINSFRTKEDIRRNLSKDMDRLSIMSTDNVTTPKDSGIEDDSLDSSHTDTNEIMKQKENTEKSNDDSILKTPRKSQPIITSTEIVTNKYKILNQDSNNKNNSNNNKRLLSKSSDIGEEKNTTLAIPSEIESLNYILKNLSAHNRYKNDFFIDNYCHDTTKENEPDNNQANDIIYTRPADLDDLIEHDDLIELDTESTLTFEDISEDDEIILMDMPKSIIDNHEFKGKNIQIKKRTVFIDGIKYEASRKPNDNLSCVWKIRGNDTDYELGILMPRASYVIRKELSQKKIESPKLISNIGIAQSNFAPFPSNLKRRNPLLVQPDCYNYKKKRNIYI